MQMIDEFTDVNEGEKELMKMWNLHVMKHGYVGDCQLPLACDMFLDMRGRDLLQKNLYRNFVLHMCSLFDYGLVSPEVIYKTIQKLQVSGYSTLGVYELLRLSRFLVMEYVLLLSLTYERSRLADSAHNLTNCIFERFFRRLHFYSFTFILGLWYVERPSSLA